MRKGLRQGGLLLVGLLPLAGCFDGLDLHDYLSAGSGSGGVAPPPSSPPPSVLLCGVENLSAVAELACAHDRAFCEQWTQCPSVLAPLEQCLDERVGACLERMVVALEAGACFQPRVFAENAANGCHERWQLQGACLLPTMEELTVATEPCADEWTPGSLGEGETCMYAAEGCAPPDVPDRRSFCAFDTSFELDGGRCVWVVDLPRGAACDPAAGDYCNGSDACLSSGICDERRALGEQCQVDNDCASLLCAGGVCTDPEGFSCAERSCPVLWSCEDDRCARRERT